MEGACSFRKKNRHVKSQKEGIFIGPDSFSNSLNLFLVIFHSGLGAFCMLEIFISGKIVREHSTPSADSYIISVTSSTIILSLGRGDYGCPIKRKLCPIAETFSRELYQWLS